MSKNIGRAMGAPDCERAPVACTADEDAVTIVPERRNIAVVEHIDRNEC